MSSFHLVNVHLNSFGLNTIWCCVLYWIDSPDILNWGSWLQRMNLEYVFVWLGKKINLMKQRRFIRWSEMNKPPGGFEPVDLDRIRRNLGFDGRGGVIYWVFSLSWGKKNPPKAKPVSAKAFEVLWSIITCWTLRYKTVPVWSSGETKVSLLRA